MIADAIRRVLNNTPLIRFIAAFLLAVMRRGEESYAAVLLAWLPQLSVGVENLRFGLLHMGFPGDLGGEHRLAAEPVRV